MQKLLFGIFALLISTIFLASCEVGKQPTINAYAPGGCKITGTCIITVAYNTNGLSVNQIVPLYYQPQQSGFSCSADESSSCSGNIVSNQSGSCNYNCLPLTSYAVGTNISFGFGSVTSNVITVTSQ